MTRPDPLSRARVAAALAARGAAPLKRHGQHFLLDDNLLAAIVADAAVGPGDVVLEVGPGPGLLTRHLLAAGARVVAAEIDRVMVEVAAELIEPDLAARLEWLLGDVLAGSRELAPAVAARLPACTAVVANLPYGVAGPLLGCLLRADRGPGRLVVMVQRELAERILAPPGGRDYGPLAVLAAVTAEGRILRRVPARAFWPPPRVESVVLRLERRSDRPDETRLRALEAFLAGAFHARRKTLVNSLAETSGLSSEVVAERLGLGENREKTRAEALGALELCALAQHWACHVPGERDRP